MSQIDESCISRPESSIGAFHGGARKPCAELLRTLGIDRNTRLRKRSPAAFVGRSPYSQQHAVRLSFTTRNDNAECNSRGFSDDSQTTHMVFQAAPSMAGSWIVRQSD